MAFRRGIQADTGACDDLRAIARMYRGVPVAVEDDRRQRARSMLRTAHACAQWAVAAHRGICRRQVARRAARETRMHAYRRVEIRISLSHDCRSRTARRQSRDIDATRIDPVVFHDLARDAGDERRLTLIALLIAPLEPVPTLRGIGHYGLLWIDDKTCVLFGGVPAAKSSADGVHPCSMTISGLGSSPHRLGM